MPTDGEGAPSGARAGAALIDTHAHLNHPRLLPVLPDVLARARAAGVSAMVVVGYDVESSRRAVELAESTPGVLAAVGVHPHDADEVSPREMAEVGRLARSKRVVAIGETGLDFFRDLSPRPAQERAFREHLALGAELGLPVIVHCRDAQEEVLGVLESAGARAPVVWHCFDGTLDHARRAVDLGLFLGFGGRVTYRKAAELREVAAAAPADRVLLETDCPYLSPEPKRGKDNEPANLAIIAGAMAEMRGEDVGAFSEVTTANAGRVFGIRREQT